MLNRCKFLNIILTTCGISNAPCRYMGDPGSCPTYDEDMRRNYIDGYNMAKMSPAKVAEAETERVTTEVESLSEFAERTINELRSIGVEAEAVDDKPEIKEPESPKKPCSICGSMEWWLRDNGWVCGWCHPKPVAEEVPDWF